MNLQGSIRIPRRPSDGKNGQDGHSPYIGANGNWWEWDDSLKLYVDTGRKAEGEKGENGLPGQIPIQKEWVVGDTHHNTEQIVDFIYVRGTNANSSYWYKLTTVGTKIAGSAPTGGSTPTGYQRVSWMDTLAVKVLIGEEANLAGFIFKGGQLISVRGTVGGVDADYSGQDGFVPNLILDGTEGDVKITGTVNAKSGSIGDLIVEQTGRVGLIDPVTKLPRLIFMEQNLPHLEDLLSTNVFGGTASNTQAITTSSIVLPNTITVDKNNSTISVVTGDLTLYHNSPSSDGNTEIYVELLRDGVGYMTIIGVDAGMPFGQHEDVLQVAGQSRMISGCPAGTYSMRLSIESTGDIVQKQITMGSSGMSWSFTQADIRYFQFGLNGMMAFFSDNHFHFTEIEGFDLRGKSNMPGTLLSATVANGGGWTNVWGAKTKTSTGSNVDNAVKNSTGRYTVYHSLGHSRYQVFASAHNPSRSHHIASKGDTSFVIEWRSIGSSPALVDTLFDVSMIGDNY